MNQPHIQPEIEEIGDHDGRYELELKPMPVVTISRHWDQELGRSERQETADTFGATLYRYAGDEEVWVFLGNESQHIDVSLESARRLHRGLEALLASCEVLPSSSSR